MLRISVGGVGTRAEFESVRQHIRHPNLMRRFPMAKPEEAAAWSKAQLKQGERMVITPPFPQLVEASRLAVQDLLWQQCTTSTRDADTNINHDNRVEHPTHQPLAPPTTM